MKKVLMITVVIYLTGCASTATYTWYMKGRGEATPEEIAQVEKECQYSQKMDQAKRAMGAAISVGRYEKNGNTSSSDKFVNEAALLITEAKQCSEKYGLKRFKDKKNKKR